MSTPLLQHLFELLLLGIVRHLETKVSVDTIVQLFFSLTYVLIAIVRDVRPIGLGKRRL
jgi:hypothetical protein